MTPTDRPLRILHCPTVVGGQPSTLARAERSLGADSHCVTLVQSRFAYPVDDVILHPGAPWLVNQFRRLRAIYCSLTRYDVIHYNFGQSLSPTRVTPAGRLSAKQWLYNNLYARWLEMLDVRIAHLLGRVIVVTYQGDDARQGDYCRTHYSIHFCHEVDEQYYNSRSDAMKRQRIAKFSRWANHIYSVNPDLLNVLPERAKFEPYSAVNPREWVPPANDVDDKNHILHVVHAPSHQKVKGTRYVLDAFAQLESEGVPFRYTLIENISNEKARKIYETADILIDQLLAGYYGGLAVELMALGKPVICYLRREDFRFMPEQMVADMPIIDAQPDTIYDVLKEYLTTRRGELKKRGAAGRQYAETWHDPQKIAARLLADYQAAFDARRKKA